MDPRYDFKQHEAAIYKAWESADAFKPARDRQSTAVGDQASNTPSPTPATPFTIIMPPPNANDPLHVGHAMFITLEDVMIRCHRMLGDDTLWLPGTDHAGIETQFVFEVKLKKQGKSRFNFDRETLYQLIWDYVQENSGVAVDQMKKLGASADWSRFKFTLDPDVVEFVKNTFKKLHQENLVYRDLRLVNYCTQCGTSYSELEVKYVDATVPLYYMKYGPFTLATTRPETKFGDTAVAVHPDDTRYQQYIGQEIEVEGLLGTFKIRVIADEYVDPKFGTGVVKITPAHDFNDYEVWTRHKDEVAGPKQVINFNGKLNELTGKYQGLSVQKARQTIAADLEARGLLVKVDTKYQTRLGTCYRCGRVIEPLPLPQFFVKVKDPNNNLTQKVLDALDAQETVILGSGREAILRHWLENLRDWNISRQTVWGIRIPAWYQVDGFEDQITVGFIPEGGAFTQGLLSDLLKTHPMETILVGLQTVQAHQSVPYQISDSAPADGRQWIQETDTFDTWFSSSQWPVVTLMTTQPGDFERFYPTSVMETGYDILVFWVMRMLIMGVYLTNKAPFSTVYLHGLIRDEKGRKMSKSKGNVLNPLEVADQYGADALRLALVIRSTPGQDKSVGHPDFKAARNLTNKIWNAARFVLMDQSKSEIGNPNNDAEFFTKLTTVVSETTTLMQELRLGQAADLLYNEFWHWYCDQVIEQHKAGQLSATALRQGLTTFLKLFHPFMPFVTEAVWQELKANQLVEEPLLITSSWPAYDQT